MTTNYERYFGTPAKLVRTSVEAEGIRDETAFDVWLPQEDYSPINETDYGLLSFDTEKEFLAWLESEVEECKK